MDINSKKSHHLLCNTYSYNKYGCISPTARYGAHRLAIFTIFYTGVVCLVYDATNYNGWGVIGKKEWIMYQCRTSQLESGAVFVSASNGWLPMNNIFGSWD